MNVVQEVKPRSFAWSYSKLKNFETCGRRYEAIDLKKSVQEEKSQELERGDKLHAAMYSRVTSDTPLPPEFIYMEKWAEKLTRVIHPFQIIQCELKLAINREGTPVGFFEKGVYLRGKIDYFRIIPTSTDTNCAPDGRGRADGKAHDIGHIVDYKTGKPREDYTQLLLSAHMVFCHYKTVQEVRTEFLWTEYNDTSHEVFKREDMPTLMQQVTPRVMRLEAAHINGTFMPNPGGLCYEYCPVTSCEYHGKRMKRAS